MKENSALLLMAISILFFGILSLIKFIKKEKGNSILFLLLSIFLAFVGTAAFLTNHALSTKSSEMPAADASSIPITMQLAYEMQVPATEKASSSSVYLYIDEAKFDPSRPVRADVANIYILIFQGKTAIASCPGFCTVVLPKPIDSSTTIEGWINNHQEELRRANLTKVLVPLFDSDDGYKYPVDLDSLADIPIH